MAWQEDTGIDVTAVFRGVTTPLRELYDEVHKRGWSVSKIDVKDGQYVATVENPYGEQLEKTGPNAETAVGNALIALMRTETMRFQGRIAAWQSHWIDQLPQIAKAYADAPVYDPKAAGAWKELAQDSQSRAQQIAQQIRVEVTNDPHPYKDVNEMVEDVTKNKHVYLTKANADHPLWSLDQMLAYRLVHDVLGHAQAGGDWGWHGENRATAAHMPLLSPSAQKALFTEAIGQSAHNNFYRNLGPQKITFLDDLQDTQDEENAPGHAGVHPSQTVVPGLVPRIPGVHESAAEGTEDPNAGWESAINPLADNAFLWQREITGKDPLDADGLKEQAHNLNTGWFNLSHPDSSPDVDAQKQAVVNAFRAVLLNPRKPFRWNAAHYQHIQHIPAGTHDPMRYFDALENQRDAYNQARGIPSGISHQLYAPEIAALKSWVKTLNGDVDDAQASDIAKRELFHMLSEEEERVASEDPDGQLSTVEIADQAAQGLKKRLQGVLKPNVDQKFDFGTERLFHEADITQPPIYGEYLASHLRPISGVSLNADHLLGAAREDVLHHGGKGHHFRSNVMDLVPGVGPKEASYAWMLLQPHTSELAVIDPILADQALDHKGSVPLRDYFKLERQLSAGRDAAGYNHVPLGQFSWGLWDNLNYGHGVHRDHSSLRPVNPVPADQVDWMNTPDIPSGSWENPYWWKSTQEARDQVGKAWDASVATQHPADEIPYKMAKVAGNVDTFLKVWRKYTPVWPQYAVKLASRAKLFGLTRDEAKQFIEDHEDDFKFGRVREEFEEKFLAAWGHTSAEEPVLRVPWFLHEGEEYEGQPGQSAMQHIRNSLGINTEDVWNLIEEVGKRDDNRPVL